MLAPKPLRERLAPVLLLLGLGGASLVLARSFPRETDVTLRLSGDRPRVAQLEASFARPGEAEGLSGATWSFPSGAVPPSVHTVVRLAPGDYEVVLAIELRDGGLLRLRQRATLKGEPVSVPVAIE